MFLKPTESKPTILLAALAALAFVKTVEPLQVVQEEIIPALNIVGEGFENKTVYLPQLLMSAEAAKSAFEVIKAKIGKAILPIHVNHSCPGSNVAHKWSQSIRIIARTCNVNDDNFFIIFLLSILLYHTLI